MFRCQMQTKIVKWLKIDEWHIGNKDCAFKEMNKSSMEGSKMNFYLILFTFITVIEHVAFPLSCFV